MQMLTDRKPSRVSKWLVVLLLLSLLVALLPLGVGAAKSSAKCAGQVAYTNELAKPYTIYAGQTLCIPDKKDKSVPKAYASISGTTKAANFVAGLTSDNKQILIHPYTYPNTTVRVKARTADGGKWYRLGTLYIGSSGNGKTYTFKVPTDLQGTRNLQICLKDSATSYLQCVKPLGQ
jgi:hypothetical protein